jgi:hypothetical protein
VTTNVDRAADQFSRAYERSKDQLGRAYERSKDVLEDASDKAKVLYRDAREWVPEHRSAVAVVSSGVIGCYLLGYLSGRARRRQALPARPPEMITTLRGQIPELDLKPFFRFVSLWMLYRVATRD